MFTPDQLLPLKSYLQELKSSGNSLKEKKLVLFSGLSGEELKLFQETWLSIPVSKRREIIHTLVGMAEDDVELDFTAVLRNCLKDLDEEIRVQAIGGLWECEERSLISSLIDLLQRDTSERVRAAAATGLGNFANLAALGKLNERDSTRVWTSLLEIVTGKEPLEIKRRAVEAMGVFNRPEVVGILEKAYQDPELKMKASALYAMGRNCDSRWLPILENELSSPHSELRYEAANACGEIGDQSMVAFLLPLLEDHDIQVKLSVIAALGTIGGAQARRALSRCLKDPDEHVQEEAAEAVANLDFAEDPLGFPLRN